MKIQKSLFVIPLFFISGLAFAATKPQSVDLLLVNNLPINAYVAAGPAYNFMNGGPVIQAGETIPWSYPIPASQQVYVGLQQQQSPYWIYPCDNDQGNEIFLNLNNYKPGERVTIQFNRLDTSLYGKLYCTCSGSACDVMSNK